MTTIFFLRGVNDNVYDVFVEMGFGGLSFCKTLKISRVIAPDGAPTERWKIVSDYVLDSTLDIFEEQMLLLRHSRKLMKLVLNANCKKPTTRSDQGHTCSKVIDRNKTHDIR